MAIESILTAIRIEEYMRIIFFILSLCFLSALMNAYLYAFIEKQWQNDVAYKGNGFIFYFVLYFFPLVIWFVSHRVFSVRFQHIIENYPVTTQLLWAQLFLLLIICSLLICTSIHKRVTQNSYFKSLLMTFLYFLTGLPALCIAFTICFVIGTLLFTVGMH